MNFQGLCCKCCCIVFIILALLSGFSIGILKLFWPYPFHASCRVNWEFGVSCSSAQSSILKQIELWSNVECTPTQQCNYALNSTFDNVIRGTRKTSGDIQFTDSFNFTFTDSESGCNVLGMSRSNVWFAVLDFGFNYCNLKNLVIGSKLDKEPNYEEKTSNRICTMYTYRRSPCREPSS